MVEWNVFLLPTTELSCEERNTTKTINLERSNHPKRIYWMLNVLLPLREAVKQVPHWNTERLCGTHKQQPLHNSTLTVYLSWNFYRSNFSSPKNVNNFKTICILESIILLQAIIQTEATRFACTRLWNYHLYIVHLLPETIINRKWISNKISLPFDWRFSCSLLTLVSRESDKLNCLLLSQQENFISFCLDDAMDTKLSWMKWYLAH